MVTLIPCNNIFPSISCSSSKNFFKYPSDIYKTTNSAGQSVKCGDVHFIEYLTSHWFNKDNNDDILNNRVLSTSVRNSSKTNPGQGTSSYRIHTGERRVTPKGAECLKWHKETWDNTICSVTVSAISLICNSMARTKSLYFVLSIWQMVTKVEFILFDRAFSNG